MNQHLQTILNIIQQDENLTAEQKNAVNKSLKDADKELEITAFKLDRTEKVKRTTAILLEETIEELEQKRKAVEAQNRELEIEASLERVRTFAMSMHKPDDMLEVCKTISLQLQLLGVKEIRNVQTAIFYEARGSYMNYEFYAKHKKTFVTDTLYTNHTIANDFAQKMLQGNGEIYSTSIKGKEVKDWLEYQKTTNVFIDTYLENAASLNYYWHSLGPVALGISTYHPLSEDELHLFQRFLKVFDLSYRRYLDIEKAIAQSKEAQIETSLERVRAQAMAMRTPEELTGICEVLFAELHTLGFTEIRNAMINIHDDEKETFVNYDYSDEIGKSINHLHYNIHPLIEKQMKEIRNAEGFSETSYTGKDLEDMITFRKKIGEKDDPRIEQAEALYYYFYSIGTGSIGISTFNIIAGEKLDVLKRFRNVFTLAYQRYTDIAQAEAQAKEAEIELALERVRARTMAMQRSDELVEVATVLFQQVKALGVPQWNCGFNIWNMGDDEFTYYPGSPDGIISPSPCKISLTEHPVFMRFDESRKRGDELLIYEKEGEEQADHYRYMLSLPGVGDLLQSMLDAGFELPKFQIDHLANFAYGNLIFITYEHFPEMHEVFKRFAKVFEQTYTRFLDLQKAEAQAREAQIEAALERVRSRTMGMQQSSELGEVAAELFHQMNLLVANLWTCGFVLCEKDRDEDEWWLSMDSGFTRGFFLPNIGDYTHAKLYEGWIKEESFRTVQLEGDDLEEHYTWLMNLPVAKSIFEEMDDAGLERPDWQKLHAAYFSKGYLVLITREPCGEEEIFKRFAQVFDQTYTRFLDLQKAEAQTREAQIELGLERVRARAMAMQKSEELSELVDTVFKELTKLDFALNWCIINIIDAPSLTNMVWAANPETNKPPESYLMKFEDYPFHHSMIKGYQERKTKHVYVLEGKEKKTYDDYLFNKTEWSRVPKAAQAASRAMKRYVATFTFSNFGGLQTVGEEYLSEENLDILSRFGKVFDLTYTRFNDLQKAEAQAREAQIEAALERVRSRSMGMQKSEELKEVIKIVYQQLRHLKINLDHAGFVVDYKPGGDWHFWIADEQDIPAKITHPYFDSVWANQFNEAKEKGADIFTTNLNFEEKNKFYNELLSYVPGLPETSKDFYLSCPGLSASTVLFEHVSLYIENFSGTPYTEEENNTLVRFGKVFQQTYTRFLDLQKAEAQAREAKIEAALERTRTQSMIMQHSKELDDTLRVFHEQVLLLGIHSAFSFLWLPDEKNHRHIFWAAWKENLPAGQAGNSTIFKSKAINYPLDRNEPATAQCLIDWKSNETVYSYHVPPPAVENYFAVWQELIDGVEHLKPEYFSGGLLYVEAFMKYGCFGVMVENDLTEDEKKILGRFAVEFERTYTRFLDLQKAEAQAREAQIELALERVRARTMAMQHSEELQDTSLILFQQLKELGEPAEQCTIGIIKESEGVVEISATLHGNNMQQTFRHKIDEPFVMNKMFRGWKGEQKTLVLELKEEELKKYNQYRNELVGKETFPVKLLPGDRWIIHIAYFSKGILALSTSEPRPAESLQLLERFAIVFEQTYTRFLDLQKAEAQALRAEQDLIAIKEARQKAEEALTELQVTQKQLIQSEKMASLGELTAGIAHEIQNPLNFVNNFSEVSNELIDEMNAEIEKGDMEEAKAIANDIKQNLEKINHHGKRADAIVKGMLQHSRSSTATKEPTDINKLADEYLRLAYHGLRAKDKSFNATMKTDFDESIGNINIIPQDIGRVILNLITNAFYAAPLPPPAGGGFPDPEYKHSPTVWVSTKKVGSNVLISVRDNGPGIPKKILDKIFQPFFTTKPTGQGTGLGLSLSYDIVKAHGGELKVETREGEGSEFVILLPV